MAITIEAGKAYIEGTENLYTNTDVYKVIFSLAKKLKLDQSKTFYSFDFNWMELKFSNNSGDSIIMFFKDYKIKSMYVYIDSCTQTKYKQYDLSQTKPVFNSDILDAVETFKNNS